MNDYKFILPIDREVKTLHNGLFRWRNPKNNFTCYIFHYSAVKDEEWIKRKRTGMTETSWLQEFEISFDVITEGNLVFPNFSEKNIKKISPIPIYPIIRSWDFGYLNSACLFCQKNEETKQLLVLKEIYLSKTYTKDLALEVLKESNKYQNFDFIDVCDPKAGVQKSEKSEHTNIEILQAMGIKVKPSVITSIKNGLNMISLLIERICNEERGLMVDADCKLLIQGFQGGYIWDGDEPIKTEIFSHLFDCLRYAVVSFFTTKELLSETKITSIREEKRNPQEEWNKFFFRRDLDFKKKEREEGEFYL